MSEESQDINYVPNYNDVKFNVNSDSYTKFNYFQPTQLDDLIIDISVHEPVTLVKNVTLKLPPELPPSINPIQYDNESFTTAECDS